MRFHCIALEAGCFVHDDFSWYSKIVVLAMYQGAYDCWDAHVFVRLQYCKSDGWSPIISSYGPEKSMEIVSKHLSSKSIVECGIMLFFVLFQMNVLHFAV